MSESASAADSVNIARSATYRICARCIMDTTDPDIHFDGDGRCNHCRRCEERSSVDLHEEEGAFEDVVARIKRHGRGNDYDCVIGVSGGVDSTFVAYKLKQAGLRPLALHVDNGWNSELAVSNIETTLRNLDIDLYTYVIDWREFRDIQRAFLEASTPDTEIPTDHAIFAALHQTAVKHQLQYIVSGNNHRTEAILPNAWARGHSDSRYIRSVHRRFGQRPLQTFPYLSIPAIIRYGLLHRHKVIRVLDYFEYDKATALRVLEDELGWRNYGGKHYESIFTRFLQAYILPRKFNIDKRRAHLSALICSGQATREGALAEMETPTYPSGLLEQDREYVLKKLGYTESEFDAIMSAAPRSYWDYPSHYSNPASKFAIRVASRIPLVLERLGL